MIRRTLSFFGLLAICGTCAAQGNAPAWREPATGMQFVSIPKGCFQMGNRVAVPYLKGWPGTPQANLDRAFDDELPQHEVCVDALWMGKYEVRAAEWHHIMGGKPARPDAPIVNVTWDDARTFAERLTKQAAGKYRFRLPTEAEWEYACRARAATEIVPDSGELKDSAWYAAMVFKREVESVGKLQPNAFGLHDMLGNAWEWVQDSYEATGYAKHGLYDPVVETAGAPRVIRGASYRSQPIHVRCAKRAFYDADASLETIGLRLVRVP